MKKNPRNVDENTVFYVLRKNGFSKYQAREVNIIQVQSQGALDTIVENHYDDASHYTVIRDEEGVARTAIEIANPEAHGSEKILALHYTTESTVGDLEKLVKKFAKSPSDQMTEWKDMLRRKFGDDVVR